MSIVLCGDLQIKESKPYSLAMNDFIEWFVKQPYCQSDNILILLGDIAENGLLTTDENDIIVNTFFKKLPFKQIYICHGNHEYSKGKSSLKFLRNLPNIKVFYKPEIIDINQKKFLFLPYLNDKINGLTMKEYYMNLPDELNCADYMIGHFAYLPIFERDKNFIPVNNIKSQHKIIGHVHSGHLNEKKDYYLGSPLIDRFDHKGKKSYIMTIDQDWKEQFHEVPRFIDYQSVNYPDVLPKKLSNYVIWDIKDSLDKELSIEYYMKLCKEAGYDFYYREIYKKIETNNNVTIKSNNTENKKFSDYLNNFYLTKNVSNTVQEILNNKLIKRLS